MHPHHVGGLEVILAMLANVIAGPGARARYQKSYR